MTPPQLLARAGQNEPMTNERLHYLLSQVDPAAYHLETYSIPPVVPYDWTQDTSDVMLDIEEMKRQTVWDLASNPPAIAADGAGKEGA